MVGVAPILQVHCPPPHRSLRCMIGMRMSRPKTQLALVVALFFVATAATAQDLLPPIQVDRHLLQAERQIKDGNHRAALETLDNAIALGKQHGLEMPAAIWFNYAQAAYEAGHYSKAEESVVRYLQDTGQQGKHYREALELLNKLDQARAEAAAGAQILAAAEPLQQLNGDLSCTWEFDHESRLVREVTEVDFSAECRLRIKKRDTWDNGSRFEEDVDTIIGTRNPIIAWTEENQCGTFLGLRFGQSGIINQRAWYSDGRHETDTKFSIYLPIERSPAHDEARIMEALRTLNGLCTRRGS